MASPIGAKGSFSITSDAQGSSIAIQITEPAGVKSENLSLSTWAASFVLANHLHKIKLPQLLQQNGAERGQISILELGAGTGLVGLSAAAIWKSKVVLTDLESIVPGLDANISLNQDAMKKAGSLAFCGSLDWTNPSAIQLLSSDPHNAETTVSPNSSSKPSIILAADTIYSSDHPELLSRTIFTWLAPGPDSRVILCCPLRMAYIDHIREFWQLMEEGGMECVDEGRESGSEEWNEVANTPYEWCVWRWRDEKEAAS